MIYDLVFGVDSKLDLEIISLEVLFSYEKSNVACTRTKN